MNAAASGSERARMRVLVVDDDEHVRVLIEQSLRASGHQVNCVESVPVAIEQLRSETYDAVLCDLEMPQVHGEQLVYWLASHTPSTKIIIISAHIDAATREKFGDHPTIQLIEKPFQLDQLIARVDSVGPKHGFFGRSIEVELFDYVQLVAIGGGDKLIRIRTPRGVGTVWFRHGDVVHAEFNGEVGEEAFYTMMADGRGSFREVLYQSPPQQTVVRSSTHLLMEAARRNDEANAGMAPPAPEKGAAVEPAANSAPSAGGETESEFIDLGDVEDDAEHSGQPAEAEEDLQFDLVDDEEPSNEPDADDSSSAAVFSLQAELEESGDWLEGDDFGAAPIDIDDLRQMGSHDFDAAEAQSRESRMEIVEPGLRALGDDETRQIMLQQFFEYGGVLGVAIISRSGAVLAQDLRGYEHAADRARALVHGAARVARLLRFNVVEGIVVRMEGGDHLLIVSMGAAMAAIVVREDHDPDSLRDSILGVSA